MNRLTAILFQWKAWTFALAICGVFTALVMLPFPEYSGSLSGFELEDQTELDNSHELDSLFGGKQKLFLEITPEDDLLNRVFGGSADLMDDLRNALPEVDIASPLTFYQRMTGFWNYGDTSLKAFMAKASEVPVLKQLIARDQKSFLLVLSNPLGDTSVLGKVDQIIDQNYTGIARIDAMSLAHIEASIKHYIGKDVLLISSLIVLFFLVFILVIFRSFKALIFTLVNVLISIGAALVLFYFFQFSINIISILVIPITLILALSDAMHLISAYIKHGDIENKELRLKQVIAHFIIPSFISSATTAAAFFSFYLFNQSPYIQEFGLITSCALMIEFVLTFAIAPFMLFHFDMRKMYEKPLVRISDFFLATRNAFTLGFGVLLLVSLAVVSQLKFNTNTEMFFPLNSKLREVHDNLKKNYHSTIDLNVYVRGKSTPASTSTPDSLYAYARRLSSIFESYPQVAGVNSATQSFYYLSEMGIPVNLFRHLGNQNPYYNADLNTYQIQVNFKEAQDIIRFDEHELKLIAESVPDHMEVVFSSPAIQMNTFNKSVATSLIKSLSTSGIVIFLMILLLSKSIKTSLYSLIPNVVPIAFVVVLYVVLGMQINILTAITAVICLGLLDDDTVHIIYRRLWLKEPMGELSFSILSSAMLLIGGFLLFVVSSFEPIRVFGWISATIFTVGIICEMTIMQWILEKVALPKSSWMKR